MRITHPVYADQHEWVVTRAGAAVTVVDLADAQVGAYIRALGWGWEVRPAAITLMAAEADDAQLARTESSACDR